MVHIIVAVILTLSILGGGTAYVAQTSLPGDALYPVKLGTEEAAMMLAGDDVARAERALGFAERRVREIEALAHAWRLEHLGLAVEKYDNALQMVLAGVEAAGDQPGTAGNLTERVARATAGHLAVFDRVYDMVPAQAKETIAHARNVSAAGHFCALDALATVDPAKAVEVNNAAIEGRLNRAGAMVERGDIAEAENALRQFEEMAEFGEAICAIARQSGMNISGVEELAVEATFVQMEQLFTVWERAPAGAQSAIRAAVANALARYERAVQALEQRGAGDPASSVTPERIREQERIRERVDQILDDTVPPALNLPASASPRCSCPGCRG
ncbi:MAG: DUF5667 domain-containing protein [Dehalococcoidia bacterium]